ncbi:hypothetical protein EMIT091MI3_30166 [Kosakonia quasisacchari]
MLHDISAQLNNVVKYRQKIQDILFTKLQTIINILYKPYNPSFIKNLTDCILWSFLTPRNWLIKKNKTHLSFY